MYKGKKALQISLILLVALIVIYGCPAPKSQVKFIKPVINQDEIIQNSSSIQGKGPIPEWVIKLNSEGIIQKSKEDSYLVLGIESNYPDDRILNPQDYLEAYLQDFVPDANLVAKELKLVVSGHYWQQLKNGKYQIFFRYTITRESINKCLSEKNKFSRKAIEFLAQL